MALPPGDERHLKARHYEWRVGRKVGRTIYAIVRNEPSDDDVLIGVMDTKALALDAVEAHNRLRQDVRLVDASEVAEWLNEPERVAAVWQGPPLAEAFLARFGGGGT